MGAIASHFSILTRWTGLWNESGAPAAVPEMKALGYARRSTDEQPTMLADEQPTMLADEQPTTLADEQPTTVAPTRRER